MNLYGPEKQERAMQSLIHDTNAAMGSMSHVVDKISQWLKDNCKTNE